MLGGSNEILKLEHDANFQMKKAAAYGLYNGTTAVMLKVDSTGKLIIDPTALSTLYVLKAGDTMTGALAIALASPLTSTNNALTITGTLPSTGAVGTGTKFTFTSAGSDIYRQTASHIIFNSGYTGSAETDGFRVENLVAGTGANAVSSTVGNLGAYYSAPATTIGSNVGSQGQALGGNQNFGLIGKAFTGKINATNGGVIGLGLNDGGGTAIQFGGFFGLYASEPTFASAALVADNGATTSPIFLGRDNGTTVFSIADGGAVLVTGTGTIGVGAVASENVLTMAKGAAGSPVTLTATGISTNVGIDLIAKTADVRVTGGGLRISGALNAVAASTFALDVVTPSTGESRVLSIGPDTGTPGFFKFSVCASNATMYSDVVIFRGPAANSTNQFTFTAAVTGSNPIISATGSDTNIGLTNVVKGNLSWEVYASGVSTNALRIAPNFGPSGDIPNSPFLYSQSTDLSIGPAGGTGANGKLLVLAYWNGSAYKSALEYANTTGAATSVLKLLKGGGTASLGATTPGVWASGYSFLQVGQYGGILGQVAGSSAGFEYNLYYDGANYRYLNTLAASEMAFGGGVFWIRTAPSGTAGNVATLTTRLAIDNVGNFALTPSLASTSDTTSAMTITKTFPTLPAALTVGLNVDMTGAGSHAQPITVMNLNLNAGYTGGASTRLFSGNNNSAGTGADGWAFVTANANFGCLFTAVGATTGHNVGNFGQAYYGTLNVGVMGKAAVAKDSATNIGVVGIGRNSGITPVQIGGYFGMNTTAPTLVSAALIADNAAETSPIFLGRDNGTTVFTIDDGGATTISTGAVSTPLTVTASAVSTRLNVDNTNATPNSGFGIKLNGVATWSIAALAANFAWYNDVDAKYAFSINRNTVCEMTVGNSTTAIGQLGVYTGTAATIGLAVRGATSQSANLQEWQTVTPTTVASISAAGVMTAAGFVGNLTGNASGTSANVTGVVAVANGGTGLSAVALGSVLVYNSANTASALTSTVGTKVLTNTAGVLTWETALGGGDMVLASVQTNSGAKTFLDTTLLLRNVANTFNGSFVNTNTANRIYTLKDASGTLAFTSDITGINSGTNTGDQTSIVGITGTIAQFNTAITDGDLATGGGTATGTNTGDNATNSQYSGLVSNATHTGDATGATALTVVALNGTSLAGLATGILKNTTTTGVPSIAVNSDLPAMSATVGGAVPTPPNNTTTFLRGDGTFSSPTLITEVEIDVGTSPVAEASINVVNASIATSSKILGGAAYKAATNKDLDECEMDALELKFEPLAGSMNVKIKGLEGDIADKFVIWYAFA